MNRFIKIFYLLLLPATVCSQEAYDYLLKARAMIDAGKYSEAVTILTEATGKKEDGRFYELRGEANLRRRALTASLSDYNKANTLVPGLGEFGLTKINAINGNVDEALAHLERNLDSPFSKSEKEIMLDPVFSLIERTPQWRQFWKKERYNIFETKIPEIEYYLSTGNRQEAAAILNGLANDYPGDNMTLYARALVDFSNQKYSDALMILSKLVGSDRKNIKFLELLAKTQFESGNNAGASVTYSQLIGLEVINAGLFLKRAECFRKTGENAKAIGDVTRYLELYPQSKEALSLAGKIEVQSGDNLKALDYFSRNLSIHPEDPACYIDRAGSYFNSRSWEFAIKDYSMALDIDPSNSEVWLNKGIALLNIGRVQDACFDLRKSLSLGNRKATALISRNCIK